MFKKIFILIFICICYYIYKIRPVIKDFDAEKTPFRETLISKRDHFDLHKLLKRVINIFNEENLLYTIAFGTLLGAMRYNNRMPWDDDVDLIIFDEKQFKNVVNSELFNKENLGIVPTSFGYKIYDKNNYRRIKMESVYPFIDIFIYEPVNQKWFFARERSRKTWPHSIYKDEDIFPLQTCLYDDMSVSCPNKPFNLLTSEYGDNWKHVVYICPSHTGFLARTYKMLINDKTTKQVLEYLQSLKK